MCEYYEKIINIVCTIIHIIRKRTVVNSYESRIFKAFCELQKISINTYNIEQEMTLWY